MSVPVANDLKEQVREATDIVALLGSYLQITPKGRLFEALCPFHADTKPSLQINPERQTWKCWPCDKGGDVFSFVQERENMDFGMAIRFLADRAGIELQAQSSYKAKPGSPDDKSTLFKAMAWAETQFHRCYLESTAAQVARDYIVGRGINGETVDRYKVGFAPNEWQWLLERAKGTPFTPEVLEAVGLVIKNEKGRTYDRFRGRVMFPIRDTQDRPIAVGGRILPEFKDDSSAKYINSPETRLYSKSEQLYSLNIGREALDRQRRENRVRNVIVMEGYTDVVVAQQEGIEAPVAVCGTALGARHINLIRRYADRVTLVLDGDEAGQKRAAEVLEMFVAGQIELRIVTLPDGMDPCDFVLKRGKDELMQMIESSPDALDFCVARETQGIDLANDTLRATPALQRILKIMARAPRLKEDTPTVFRLREQQTLSRLSRMFHNDEPLLRKQLTELREAANSKGGSGYGESPQPKARQTLSGWERELFTVLLRNPDAIAAVLEKIAPDDMRTEPAKTLLRIYQVLDAQGHVTDFQHVMDFIEDLPMKSLLVELADEAERIHTEDGELQLRELLAAYTGRRDELERKHQMSKLLSGSLKDEEELDFLKQLYEAKKLESHDS